MARPAGPRGQARGRVIAAALDLFAEYGVSGTSLQMIADRLGVTKAAVYFQFRAKEDIVVAVVEAAFDDLRTHLTAAESAADPDESTELALRGLVDVMITHRLVSACLVNDPAVGRIVASHAEMASLGDRLAVLLDGPRPGIERRVATSVVLAGLAQAGMDPRLADIDDTDLREHLLAAGRRLLTRSRP